MHAETPKAASAFAIRIKAKCPKCGFAVKMSKLSCCAPGGAWYQNCGDVTDTKFGHTWVEGIEACKRELEILAV